MLVVHRSDVKVMDLDILTGISHPDNIEVVSPGPLDGVAVFSYVPPEPDNKENQAEFPKELISGSADPKAVRPGR